MFRKRATDLAQWNSTADATLATAESVAFRWLTYFLILAAALSYLLAKSVITGGRVTVGQFEYWLLGLAAIAIVLGVGRAIRPSKRRKEGKANSLLLLWCWLCSLAIFVFLRVTYFSESFEFPVYRALSYDPILSNAAVAMIYALGGFALTVAIAWLFEREFPVSVQRAPLAILLNCVLFFVLVFSI